MKKQTFLRVKRKKTYHVRVGRQYWFEYHCNEADDSADADLWYHSHRRVLVIKLEAGGFGDNEVERADEGQPAVFNIVFRDGFKGSAFEDELLDTRKEFCRPDPPLPFKLRGEKTFIQSVFPREK